jgi:hypothetical protein
MALPLIEGSKEQLGPAARSQGVKIIKIHRRITPRYIDTA